MYRCIGRTSLNLTNCQSINVDLESAYLRIFFNDIIWSDAYRKNEVVNQAFILVIPITDLLRKWFHVHVAILPLVEEVYNFSNFLIRRMIPFLLTIVISVDILSDGNSIHANCIMSGILLDPQWQKGQSRTSNGGQFWNGEEMLMKWTNEDFRTKYT